MKLNKILKSELELLSYTEIAKMYLEENKKTMTTAELFKEVCNLLELSDDEYVDKIADFFESLTTSKEFILTEDGKWDLKSNHSVKIVIEDIDEEEEIEEETNDNIDDIELEEDIDDNYSDDNYIDDDDNDDLAELTIVDEEEMEDE